MDQEENTRPDTLKAIWEECRLTRVCAETSANASLETRAEVKTLVARVERLETRDNVRFWVPITVSAFSFLGTLVLVVLVLAQR